MKRAFAREYRSLEQWHWWFRGRIRILESILRRELPPDTSREILSAGCGPAEGLTWLVQFAGRQGRVVGFDIDPAHALNVPDQVEFVTGSLERTPFENSSFDVILALDVLEHLHDDLAGLRELIRLLKPGGLLVISVPALPFLWGGQDIVSEHQRRYTRGSLASLLRQADLRECEITYFNTLLFPIAAGVRMTRALLGTADRARSDFEGSRPGRLNDVLAGVFGAERYLVNRIPLPVGLSLLATCRL
jgi:SAM-dependent methyltransferase